MRNVLTVLLGAALLAGLTLGAEKKPVYPKGASKSGPFSPAIVFGDTLYVSGMVGRDPKTGNRPEEFEEEVKQTLEAIRGVMREAGYDLKDAVSVQVYLTDMELFQRMNKVYMEHFPEPRPTRTTVGIAKLVGNYRIEITVTARK
jgi:2-iminobutanoate/2-iminopropanoate deaminase